MRRRRQIVRSYKPGFRVASPTPPEVRSVKRHSLHREDAAMSRFLVELNDYDLDRLKVLQAVYDWLEDFVADKNRLALAILEIPVEVQTFEQVLEYICCALDLKSAIAADYNPAKKSKKK